MCNCGTTNAVKTARSVTDVVCGMQIDPEKAAAKADYRGESYYFCGSCCKSSFESKPAQYVHDLVGKDH